MVKWQHERALPPFEFCRLAWSPSGKARVCKTLIAGSIPAQASKNMTTQEILNKYIEFYKARGHKLIPNVSLVPEGDSTLLFVNSGMFPLVPYLSGGVHPLGKRLVNVQRAGRFQEDLEEVGDNRHTTAFHMMGNWSLGDYFKEEQLPWVYEFFVKEMGLDPQKLYSTVFAGDSSAPKDAESIELLKKIYAGYDVLADEGTRIFPQGVADNWWKRGDAVGELGGPDSETFYYIGEGTGMGKNPAENQDDFLEIGNSVFMQYKKSQTGWEPLVQKNVDFGGGLERIAMVVQGKNDIFETDNFWPIVEKIQELTGKNYYESVEIKRYMRILADHMRASIFMAMDGVIPSNKDQGYMLRRLLRRMTRAGMVLGANKDLSVSLVGTVCEMFAWMYPDLVSKQTEIEKTFEDEEIRFRKTLVNGSKELRKVLKTLDPSEPKDIEEMWAHKAFDLYQSVGYPAEIFLQDIKDAGQQLDGKKFSEKFDVLFEEHKSGSRAGAEQKFKGGLADHSEEVVKYHTTTHLLQEALRQVLGEHVRQMGSNITSERLRFDFSHPDRKLTEGQIKKLEEIVNSYVAQKLPVNFVMMPKAEAEKTGALFMKNETYPDEVKVYYIGESISNAVSKEFCGGPHVSNTSELAEIKIYKQENIGDGKLRIYASFKKPVDTLD